MKNSEIYLKKSYIYEYVTSIKKIENDENGSFFLFDETIFYPQGGGQPSDSGFIENENFKILIHNVKKLNNEIRHYFKEILTEETLEKIKNSKIKISINSEKRILNSKYHTATHLLSHIIESLDSSLKTKKAHSFPNEAYLEFESKTFDFKIIEKLNIEKIFKELVNKDLKINIFEIDTKTFEKKFYKLQESFLEKSISNIRIVEIENQKPIPCGGTHLKSLGEIKNMEITKIKIKNEILKISFFIE